MATRDMNIDCKLYVGELGYGAAKQELEDVFTRYGPLKNVWVARNPPGFAFVEFEDSRDAEDAVALDGTRINGRRVRVELSNGKSRWGSRGPPPARRGSRDGGGRDSFRDRQNDREFRDIYRPRRRSRSGSRSRSRSPYRKRSLSPRRRSNSRSRSPKDRSAERVRDRSPERVRDRSPERVRDRSPERVRDRSRSRSRST